MNVFGDISNKMQQRLDMSELSDVKIKESIDNISRQVMAKATGKNDSGISSSLSSEIQRISLDEEAFEDLQLEEEYENTFDTSLDSFEDSRSSINENSHDEPLYDDVYNNGTDDLYIDDNGNQQSTEYLDPNDEYGFPAPPDQMFFPEQNQSSKPTIPRRPSLLSKPNKKIAKVLKSYQFDSIQVYYTLLYDQFLNPRNFLGQSRFIIKYDDDFLTLTKDDLVEILESEGDDWFRVKTKMNKIGLYPKNWLELLK